MMRLDTKEKFMQWSAKAPANIALIKYMGKESFGVNIPANPSLSYTLPHLVTQVVMELYPGSEDIWEPLESNEFTAPLLNLAGQQRFLKHLNFLKQQFGYAGKFKVKSANNFPHGAGLASSASSFAALTMCASQALAELTQRPLPSLTQQAQWSREGSGSSCRSFFSPWSIWESNTASKIELPYPNLIHQVILIESDEKKISSSEAHRRIQTSPYYSERPSQAKKHLTQLLDAFNYQQWQKAFEICWQEFQDMHQLFHSANPGFSYFTPATEQVLLKLKTLWAHYQDGPVVTMDAGPNIHLLYRPEQKNLALEIKKIFAESYHVL